MGVFVVLVCNQTSEELTELTYNIPNAHVLNGHDRADDIKLNVLMMIAPDETLILAILCHIQKLSL
jgi:hypothetical protein